MGKKEDKRLCWNCDGNVTFDLSQCPYCGVTLESVEESNPFATPFNEKSRSMPSEPMQGREEEKGAVHKKPSNALLLILPGASLALFGAFIMLFAEDGILTLSWKENLAYFYLLSGIPLLAMGWRALKKHDGD